MWIGRNDVPVREAESTSFDLSAGSVAVMFRLSNASTSDATAVLPPKPAMATCTSFPPTNSFSVCRPCGESFGCRRTH